MSVTPGSPRGGARRPSTAAVTCGSSAALALDQHQLARLVGEAGGRDDHVAALGLAAARRRLVDLVQADPAADDGGEDDEQDPAEDRGLAVLRAPATGSGGEIAGLIQRPVLLQGAAEGDWVQPPRAARTRAGGSQASEPDAGLRGPRGARTASRGWPPPLSRRRADARAASCPPPGRLSISSVPPTAAIRSRSPSRPEPEAEVRSADAVVADLDGELTVAPLDGDPGAASRRRTWRRSSAPRRR